MEKKVFEIDGARFSDLGGFFDEISKIVGNGWGKNLNAFADILRGDMGTPFDDPFILVWKNSALSRERLGYEATAELWGNGFRHYSMGLPYEKFTRYWQHRNWLRRFGIGIQYVKVETEQAQTEWRFYENKIASARQHQGETIFDWIMDCFRDVPEIEVRLE